MKCMHKNTNKSIKNSAEWMQEYEIKCEWKKKRTLKGKYVKILHETTNNIWIQ